MKRTLSGVELAIYTPVRSHVNCRVTPASAERGVANWPGTESRLGRLDSAELAPKDRRPEHGLSNSTRVVSRRPCAQTMNFVFMY
jgi:hypothetical protein